MNVHLHETEAGFTDWVIDCAQTFGWLVHHDRPARLANGEWRTAIQGDKGFPDIIAVGWGRIVVAELKRTARDVPTDAQDHWLWQFGHCQVEAHVWRPGDRDEIEATFRRKNGPRCLP